MLSKKLFFLRKYRIDVKINGKFELTLSW